MDNIVHITLENFQQVIIEQSKQTLIMVGFWAEWDESSLQTMAMLERIAAEYPSDLILAKVNCDEQQQIAQQFGVRGLPTVMLVKESQPIDGFAGPQEEAEVRALLEKHLPKVEDGLLAQAQALIAEQDYQQAFGLAKQAYDIDNQRVDIKFVLTDIYIELGRIAQAKELLGTVGLVDQDHQYSVLLGKIELAEQAAESPEIKALEAELEKSPDDLELKVKLGVQLQQANRTEEALALLLTVLQKDLNFGEAKKLTLDMINALPDGDPLAGVYRRKIYSLLY
ncbi:co-chaperone YbbN [Alteromonadaceae bacterium M269]|nr:co-chaperone YbbN [Alteromonadaceae bacterium M269]